MIVCPMCDNLVDTPEIKDTVECKQCFRPLEVYPDGRVELSPLYWAPGRVTFTDRDVRSFSMNPYTQFTTIDVDTDDLIRSLGVTPPVRGNRPRH